MPSMRMLYAVCTVCVVAASNAKHSIEIAAKTRVLCHGTVVAYADVTRQVRDRGADPRYQDATAGYRWLPALLGYRIHLAS